MDKKRTSRLKKELKDLETYGDTFKVEVDPNNFQLWKISFKGADGTLYAQEDFTLQFKFPNDYPIESPEVIFVGHVPTHQHIYSNGFICLSILYNEWSPALRVSSVCLSILSMLSSATKKVKPHGDAEFSAKKFTGPKQIRWFFDDDKV